MVQEKVQFQCFNIRIDRSFIIQMITKGQVTAFLGLLNGMIGGTILVLPLLGIKTGFTLIPLVSVFYGAIACYTCQLIIQHLGQCHNIREAILQHFHNKHYVTVIYNLVIGGSLLGFIINYFVLIIIQIEGFINPSPWIAFCVFIFLVLLTIVMRYFHFGEKLLAIGILSIVAYTGFLIWAQFTAPSGEKSVPATGPQFINLAASLTMGYAIHDFVVQILLNTTTHDKFRRVVFAVFVGGIIIYTFISFGAYAVVNRQPEVDEPETIQGYFPRTGWQVRLIQIIYAFHLFTASPQFCIIMRIRFLQMCKIEDTPKITIPQLLIYIGAYGIAYAIYASGAKVATIIQINGSVIGFLYIFLIPIAVHIKCVYFTKHDQDGVLVVQQQNEKGEMEVVPGNCRCTLTPRSKLYRTVQLVVQIAIIIIGIATVLYTMHNLFGEEEEVSDLKPEPNEDI